MKGDIFFPHKNPSFYWSDYRSSFSDSIFRNKDVDYSSTSGESFLELIKTGIIASLIVHGLTLPRANIAIVDRDNSSKSEIIPNVLLVNVFIDYVFFKDRRCGSPIGCRETPQKGVAIGVRDLNEILTRKYRVD